MALLYDSSEHVNVFTQLSYGSEHSQTILFVRVHQDDPERDPLAPNQRNARGVYARYEHELLCRILGESVHQLDELIPLGHSAPPSFYDAS